MWFAQKNYLDKQGINGKYTIAEIGCFLTSFCNLLLRLGHSVDPATLNRIFTQRGTWVDVDDGIRDDLGWGSILSYYPQLRIAQTGGPGWPNTTNAILKFYYQSVSQPYITVGGVRRKNMIYHFCAVADHNARTIIDSWDGQVKQPGPYGEPVAWASYAPIVAEPVIPVTPPQPKPGSTYTMLKGDTLWEIAKRFNTTAATLMEHNGITDARTIAVGTVIHLPVAQPVQTPEAIRYELLPEPRKMHIKKPGGAEKWAFGSFQKWTDIVSNGHTAEHTNLEIVAIAHVPLPPNGAAYYMDKIALGNYIETGRVAYNLGYSWADVADGWIEAPQTVAAAEPEPIVPEPEPIPEPAPNPDPIANPTPGPNSFKASYRAFAGGTVRFVLKPTTTGHLLVEDLDERGPDKLIKIDKAYEIAGTFIKDNTLYGRPIGAVQAAIPTWYGIPMSAMISEDDLYNINIDTETKRVTGQRLSAGEYWAAFLGVLTSLHTRILTAIKAK